MHYQSDGTQVAARPAPKAVTGTPGYASAGVLGTTPPSDIDPDLTNAVIDELCGIVLAAGMTPSKSNNAQVLAAIKTLFRTKLLAHLDLYVSPSGSDASAGTQAAPFATLQAAWNAIINSYDLNGNTVTVHVADGTYTGGLSATGALVGNTSGASGVTFVGDATTPGNCLVSVANGNAFLATAGAVYSISGFALAATGSASGQGQGITSFAGSQVNIAGPLIFGSCSQAHISAASGGSVSLSSGYSVGAGANEHWAASTGGSISGAGIAITLMSDVFVTAFAVATLAGVINVPGITFNGTATGARYSAIQNAVINTNSGGANYLPGNAAGSTGTGGQYT